MAEELKERLVSTIAEHEKSKKTDWSKLDFGIQYTDDRNFKIPGDPAKMPLKVARDVLDRKIRDEETDVQVYEIIDAYPLDAAVAFVKAMQRLYGWASPVAVPGFFGPKPPTYMGVKVGRGKGDIIQCPLGGFMLPGVSKRIETGIYPTDNKNRQNLSFIIHGIVLQKDKEVILELANETRRIVENESIYKGKAVRIIVDDDGVFGTGDPPEFMDTSKVGEEDLIFSKDIADEIYDNVLVPIKFTDDLKRFKESTKRTVLLEGPYGTGKSLTAAMVARVCEDNGWTFILLNKVQGLRPALEFANRFSPAVVFAEDIDRVAVERDEEMNDLINVIDGVVSKTSQIMTILTTNHADKLHPVILRPGRLDAVISLKAPDAATVKRLLAHYAGKLLPKDADLTNASNELAGQIPASIAECVKRAKLGMIGRGADKLSDQDIFTAARTMKNHLALLNRDETAKSTAEILAETLHKVVHNGRGEAIDQIPEMAEKVSEIYEHYR